MVVGSETPGFAGFLGCGDGTLDGSTGEISQSDQPHAAEGGRRFYLALVRRYGPPPPPPSKTCSDQVESRERESWGHTRRERSEKSARLRRETRWNGGGYNIRNAGQLRRACNE
jgi:hypothetical protein